METQSHAVPVSVLLSRLEKHRDEIDAAYQKTGWWQIVKRQRLKGAKAAYDYEIEQLLEITARWQPFWKELKVTEK